MQSNSRCLCLSYELIKEMEETFAYLPAAAQYLLLHQRWSWRAAGASAAEQTEFHCYYLLKLDFLKLTL